MGRVVAFGTMKAPHRLHVSTTADQIEKLKAESALTGAPVAEIVRRAVFEYLARCGKRNETLAVVERAEAAALAGGGTLPKGFFGEIYSQATLKLPATE